MGAFQVIEARAVFARMQMVADKSLSIQRTAPLLLPAIGVIAGIVFDYHVAAQHQIYIICFLAVLIAALARAVRARWGAVCVFVAASCLGGLMHAVDARAVAPGSISVYASEVPSIARVRGRVVSGPWAIEKPSHDMARWTFGSTRSVFLMEVESVEGVASQLAASGRLRVVAGEPILDLRENERVEIFGKIYAFSPPMNPGSFDWRAHRHRQEIDAGFFLEHRENVRRLDEDYSQVKPNLLSRWRSWVRRLLVDDYSGAAPEEMSLLDAMVLGQRSKLDQQLNMAFTRAGCAHFLAVSGMHVGAVLAMAAIVGRLGGLTRRRSALLMLVVVVAYALITEPRPSIMRATVMASLFCLSLMFRRSRTGLNWISAAALLLLCADPESLFGVGFQLSFVAVLGVVYLSPALTNAIFGVKKSYVTMSSGGVDLCEDGKDEWAASRGPIRRLVSRTAVPFFMVSASAWLATAPIVAMVFNRCQMWGAINSCLVFPLVVLVMGLSFVKMIAELISPVLGSVAAVPLGWADSALIWLVEELSHVPGSSVEVSPPPWLMLFAYFAILSLVAWRFSTAKTPDEFRDQCARGANSAINQAGDRSSGVGRIMWLACAACLVFGAVAWLAPWRSRDSLVVHVLAVGDGLCTVIEMPDGGTILYDVGTLGPYDVGKRTVAPFLRHEGIDEVDCVYVSHANLDHYSGLCSLMEEVPIGKVTIGEHFRLRAPAGGAGSFMLGKAEQMGIAVVELVGESTRWEFGGVMFERLWPVGPRNDSLETNDTSLVIRLTYSGQSILLTGDIEDFPQREIVAVGDLEADVLVLPHHGGVCTSTQMLIEAVDPQVAIRSSGQRMDETNNGLAEVVGARRLLNTADCGAVTVVMGNDGLFVRSFREGG